MLLPKSNTPRWIIIIGDILISLFALFFSYLIRFDLEAKEELIKEEWEILSKSILVYIGVKLTVFYLFKIHKNLIRHTSTEDFLRIVKATFVSSVFFAVFGLIRNIYLDGSYLFPTSV
jgi:FlaA1/EpsC-like NDP-sugar epimerase